MHKKGGASQAAEDRPRSPRRGPARVAQCPHERLPVSHQRGRWLITAKTGRLRRDRALLLVGFAAALRPSEISGLALAQVTHHADGIELFLPWRKNDQDARGTRLWLPKGRTELCPATISRM